MAGSSFPLCGNVQLEEIGSDRLEGPDLPRRLALRNGVRATLDRTEDESRLLPRFLWGQPPMLAYAGSARAAILPVLRDVALAAIAERGDAEAANGLTVASIPKDFPVLARRAGEGVNAGLGNRSGRHVAPLETGSR